MVPAAGRDGPAAGGGVRGGPGGSDADESSRVGGFGLEEAVAASTEPWFRERIYKKLNEKLAGFPAGR